MTYDLFDQADAPDTRDGEEPRLTATIVEDRDEVCTLLQAWVRADESALTRRFEIERQTACIRDLAEEHIWCAVVDLLRAVQERDEDLGVMIAQRSWACARGRRDEHRGQHVEVRHGDEGLPVLDLDILSDSTRLSLAVDAVLTGDTGLSALSNQVANALESVGKTVSRRAYREVLRIEELSNERFQASQEILVTWAFEAGLRVGRDHGIAR